MNDTSRAEVGLAAPAIEGIVDLRAIGRGGFGTVFRGHQADINRIVAIKVLNGHAHDVEGARRFRREVTAMGAISHHPNVVPVYAIGTTDDGRPFLMMPYLPGGTLGDRLGTLSWPRMVDVGAKLSGALQAAHDVGVLHRDVKPANILWSAWDEPQLADFGIARLHDATRTAPGPIVASLTWAAPEVLEGKPASPASDVYSLAASLHAAVTGRSPHAPQPDEPMATTVARIVSEPPADLTPFGVPRPVNDVLAAALAKDPAQRPESARAFGDALVAAAAAPAAISHKGPPVPAVEPDIQPDIAPAPTGSVPFAPSPESPPSVGPPRRRRRAVAALIGVALVVVAAFFGGRALLSRDDSRAATNGRPGQTTAAPAGAPSTPSTAATTAPALTNPASHPATSPAAAPTSAPDARGPREADANRPKKMLASYYQLLGRGSYATTWAQLTPAYQQRIGGYSAYTAFWQHYDKVELSRVRQDGDLAATATLRYHQRNGTTIQESGRFQFVRLASGSLAIDAYRVSSRTT